MLRTKVRQFERRKQILPFLCIWTLQGCQYLVHTRAHSTTRGTRNQSQWHFTVPKQFRIHRLKAGPFFLRTYMSIPTIQDLSIASFSDTLLHSYRWCSRSLSSSALLKEPSLNSTLEPALRWSRTTSRANTISHLGQRKLLNKSRHLKRTKPYFGTSQRHCWRRKFQTIWAPVYDTLWKPSGMRSAHTHGVFFLYLVIII